MPQLSILHQSILSALDSLIDRLNSTREQSVIAILVGTTDGIGLARCYGTAAQPNLSEEILSSVETIWSTLPSNSPQGAGNLLHALRMGTIQSSIAFYNDDLAMIHLHLFPLMVTVLANGNLANMGAIRANFEAIRNLLEPLRRELENNLHQQQQTAYGGGPVGVMKV